MNLERMVRRLYETRQAASEAKKDRAPIAERLGKCVDVDEDHNACYASKAPPEEWCAICREKQPIHENYHIKTNAAALRAVLRAGKKIKPNTT